MIQFDDIEKKEVQQLMFELAGFPNGTVLSCGQPINYVNRPKDRWVYWFEDEYVNRKMNEEVNLFEHLANTKGVRKFHKLDVNKSVHDDDWKWEDEYLENIFGKIIHDSF
jgi:hypothetical protein